MKSVPPVNDQMLLISHFEKQTSCALGCCEIVVKLNVYYSPSSDTIWWICETHHPDEPVDVFSFASNYATIAALFRENFPVDNRYTKIVLDLFGQLQDAYSPFLSTKPDIKAAIRRLVNKLVPLRTTPAAEANDAWVNRNLDANVQPKAEDDLASYLEKMKDHPILKFLKMMGAMPDLPDFPVTPEVDEPDDAEGNPPPPRKRGPQGRPGKPPRQDG